VTAGLKTEIGREGNPGRSNDYSTNFLRAIMGRRGQGLQSRNYEYGNDYSESPDQERSEGEGWIDASVRWDNTNQWNCGKSSERVQPDEVIGGRVARPHAFPWMARICGYAGNPSKSCRCAGALITSKHVLTAFHCVVQLYKDPCTKRDHSDGKRFVILGRNSLTPEELNSTSLYRIPIADVRHPPLAGLRYSCKDSAKAGSHDFAMYILSEAARFSPNIQPICLPHQDAKYEGETAIAAGWGRFTTETEDAWTRRQSNLLKQVNLKVSNSTFEHEKMFGTLVEKRAGEYQEPCAGDSGGPLMYKTDGPKGRWVVIGTVKGGGFDCRDGTVDAFDGHKEGVWNRVSAHTTWILDEIAKEE